MPVGLPDGTVVVDLVGTGGDRCGSINVTTLASFITAGCGVPVCKHGNRAASSAVGTADVLEALGVAIEIGPEGVAECVRTAGMGFCFAQRFHPAMRFVGPVRKELGVPTVFNYLGPLTNPARTRYQLVGVSTPPWPDHGQRFGATGSRRTFIIHADDGLDELSVTSPASVLEVRPTPPPPTSASNSPSGASTRPTSASRPAAMADLKGGDAAFNAKVIRSVLEGEAGARRDIGILNAAAALMVAGRVTDLASGLILARESIDSGRAVAVLDRARRYVTSSSARPAGLIRQARLGEWATGSKAGESPVHKAMTQPPNPPPVIRTPRTPG